MLNRFTLEHATSLARCTTFDRGVDVFKFHRCIVLAGAIIVLESNISITGYDLSGDEGKKIGSGNRS